MKWIRRDQYWMESDPPGWAICRINFADRRCYELHDLSTKTCVARRWCSTDSEARTAVAELKGVAGELLRLASGESVQTKAG